MLQPTRQVTPSTATCPRVIKGDAQRPRVGNTNQVRPPRVDNINNNNKVLRPLRVNNNTNNDATPQRVLRPRAEIHQQKYSRGTRVYKIFGEPTRLVEHKGYISDFDNKGGYYKVIYNDGDTISRVRNLEAISSVATTSR